MNQFALTASHRFRRGLISCAAVLATAAACQAAVVISFTDEAGGVRVNVTGSLNTTGLSFGSNFTSSGINMQVGREIYLRNGSSYKFASHGGTVPVWHSLSAQSLPNSGITGNLFGINAGNVMVSSNYVSGTPFTTSVLLTGQTIATMQPKAGVILTLNNGDTVSVNAVPEASSALLGSLAGLALLRRRR